MASHQLKPCIWVLLASFGRLDIDKTAGDEQANGGFVSSRVSERRGRDLADARLSQRPIPSRTGTSYPGSGYVTRLSACCS